MVKVCNICGKEKTRQWYSGPICATCYEKTRRNNFTIEQREKFKQKKIRTNIKLKYSVESGSEA